MLVFPSAQDQLSRGPHEPISAPKEELLLGGFATILHPWRDPLIVGRKTFWWCWFLSRSVDVWAQTRLISGVTQRSARLKPGAKKTHVFPGKNHEKPFANLINSAAEELQTFRKLNFVFHDRRSSIRSQLISITRNKFRFHDFMNQ